eukprot:522945_1
MSDFNTVNLIQTLFLCSAIFSHGQYIDFSEESTYFLSSNMLTWRSANNYCRHICGNSLASIHTIKDQISAQYIIENAPIMNTRKVWIGLYFSSRDNEWKWTDNTPITNLSVVNVNVNNFSTSPVCVMMNIDLEFQWEIKFDTECDESAFFLCNHCDGKLIKYALLHNETATFEESNNFCKLKMDTNLISIHSNYDYIQ